MEIKPDTDRSLEDTVTQAVAISQIFKETVRLNVNGTIITIKPTNTELIFAATLQELKLKLDSPLTIEKAKSKREVAQISMANKLKQVCPPYVTFRLDGWEKTENVESWTAYFLVADKPLEGITVGRSKKLGRPYIGSDTAELTRENLDHCIQDRLEGRQA